MQCKNSQNLLLVKTGLIIENWINQKIGVWAAAIQSILHRNIYFQKFLNKRWLLLCKKSYENWSVLIAGTFSNVWSK